MKGLPLLFQLDMVSMVGMDILIMAAGIMVADTIDHHIDQVDLTDRIDLVLSIRSNGLTDQLLSQPDRQQDHQRDHQDHQWVVLQPDL